jgi:hypothetical protein
LSSDKRQSFATVSPPLGASRSTGIQSAAIQERESAPRVDPEIPNRNRKNGDVKMKTLLASIALATAALVSVPAMAEVGCKPGDQLSNVKATKCDDSMWSLRSDRIAAPGAYALVPAPHVAIGTPMVDSYAYYGAPYHHRGLYGPYHRGPGFGASIGFGFR